MTRFIAPDLSALSAPDIIETLDYEAIAAARLVRLKQLWPEYDTGDLETDPLRIAQQSEAYFELLLRARVNDAARAILVTHARGADLDHLGAFHATARQAGETDADYRERILLAPEAYAAAGPAGAYEYHARAADPDVKGVGLSVPRPGHVEVAVLSRSGDGTASAALVEAVRRRLMRDDVRPLTDAVTVKPAQVTPYEIRATLYVPAGPDPDLLRSTALEALSALARSRHKVEQSIHASALIAAAHVANVAHVVLTAPAGDLIAAPDQAYWCTGVTVSVEVLP